MREQGEKSFQSRSAMITSAKIDRKIGEREVRGAEDDTRAANNTMDKTGKVEAVSSCVPPSIGAC